MQRVSLTHFGSQPVTAELIRHARSSEAMGPVSPVDKWSLLRELTTARAAFNVSDRDLAVLNALLSFYPEQQLASDGPLIVFPSNAALCARAHGMAESTLRRHIAALISAGLIARRDSPNGKRYPVRRTGSAFGFDLRPLLLRAVSIAEAAKTALRDAEDQRAARASLTLLLRDAVKLMLYGRETGVPGDWDAVDAEIREIQKRKRRKLSQQALSEAITEAENLLTAIEAKFEIRSDKSEMLSANDSQNERHLHNSDSDNLDIDPVGKTETRRQNSSAFKSNEDLPSPALVTKACPDILPYAGGKIRTETGLIQTADFIYPMIGISGETWRYVYSVMGRYKAAITLAAILQRCQTIKNPGGYLRKLADQARAGRFSPAPMIFALLKSGQEI